MPSDIRELLVRRAERLRKPATSDEHDEDAVWVAMFSLGVEQYAIPLPALRAAVPLRAVTPVPRASRLVVGIFQFEGEVIAVLSTAALLASGWSVNPTIMLVVDTGRGRTVALDCAQVPVAMTLPSSGYHHAKATARGALSLVAVPGRGVVNVVDVARLLEEHDWDRPHADS
ncbi:MAG: chemotaxis protein CheW [Myxococcota bacterium]|nr:chemotaxis protein CheW [Myxococcota bacterium]